MSIPILAVDPSLRATGYATYVDLPSGGTHARHGTIQPRIRTGGRWRKLEDPERMLYIAGQVRELARRHDARLVALEAPSFGSQSSNTDRIGGLHWIIRAALHGAHLPWIIIPPATLKLYATGFGRAPKRTEHDHRGVLRTGMVDAARDDLDYAGRSDDEADALWIHALVSDALGLGYAPDLGDPHARAQRRHAVSTVVPLLPTAGVLTATP